MVTLRVSAPHRNFLLVAALLRTAEALGRRRRPERAAQRATDPCSPYVLKDQQLQGPVVDAICEKLGNISFLVFGTGYDSPLWVNANSHGRTFFFEDNDTWVRSQPPNVQSMTALVRYTSRRITALRDLNDEPMLASFFTTQVPQGLKDVAWDQILVDGPEGHRDGTPGRGQSIYAASRLGHNGTVIFVEDCNRIVEDAYLRRWLLRPGRGLRKMPNGHGGETCRVGPPER